PLGRPAPGVKLVTRLAIVRSATEKMLNVGAVVVLVVPVPMVIEPPEIVPVPVQSTSPAPMIMPLVASTVPPVIFKAFMLAPTGATADPTETLDVKLAARIEVE